MKIEIENENNKITTYLFSGEFRNFRRKHSVKIIREHIDSKNYIYHKVLFDDKGNFKITVNNEINHKEVNVSPNNKTRELLNSMNITPKNVTVDMVNDLVEVLNKHLKSSGIYNGTAKIDKVKNFKFLTMSTEDWKGRESVSFNSDGFIGFCGWADSKNTEVILSAVEEWALNQNIKH